VRVWHGSCLIYLRNKGRPDRLRTLLEPYMGEIMLQCLKAGFNIYPAKNKPSAIGGGGERALGFIVSDRASSKITDIERGKQWRRER